MQGGRRRSIAPPDEYAAGLAAVRRPPVGLGRAIQLLLQTCTGVECAHRAQVLSGRRRSSVASGSADAAAAAAAAATAAASNRGGSRWAAVRKAALSRAEASGTLAGTLRQGKKSRWCN